MQLKRSLSIE